MGHRFQRLAKGGRKVALTDFQSVPELAGNPFIMRIFQLFDADQDGCLNFEEFIRAVESFGRLYSSEDKCMCKLLLLLRQCCCVPAMHSCVIFQLIPWQSDLLHMYSALASIHFSHHCYYGRHA